METEINNLLHYCQGREVPFFFFFNVWGFHRIRLLHRLPYMLSIGANLMSLTLLWSMSIPKNSNKNYLTFWCFTRQDYCTDFLICSVLELISHRWHYYGPWLFQRIPTKITYVLELHNIRLLHRLPYTLSVRANLTSLMLLWSMSVPKNSNKNYSTWFNCYMHVCKFVLIILRYESVKICNDLQNKAI